LLRKHTQKTTTSADYDNPATLKLNFQCKVGVNPEKKTYNKLNLMLKIKAFVKDLDSTISAWYASMTLLLGLFAF